MQPDTENLEQRQDRDRREQELLLLALFLGKLREDGTRTGGLMDVARNRADSALSLGADPFAAVADVLAGNVLLRMPPAWPRVSRLLREADVAGYRRTVRVIGEPAEVDGYVPVTDHASVARQVVARLLQYVQSAIADGIRTAALKGGSTRRAVAEAFVRAGLVESATSKSWHLHNVAEVLIGFAYQGGAYVGWHRPGLEDSLLGFEYVTVHDDRRTIICKAYDGVKLPTSDVWWEYHWPLNHWGCRSWCKPLFKAFTPTANPPWVPAPTPGFGRAPVRSIGLAQSA